ncbi:unnamed protein product [Nezara viridula]|uniref:Neuropeptide n=1 Tax=Nezara viridula TaxID=85310 RepID=A0A9P0EDB5_NEZVI|nr:unnamed protein product [Nezara viridula]
MNIILFTTALLVAARASPDWAEQDSDDDTGLRN